MTQQPPIRSSALRGAVDLSGLGQSPPAATTGAPSPGGGGTAGAGAIRVDGTDAGFQELILGTRQVAALVVLWSSSHPETEAAIEAAVAAAAGTDGLLRVIAVDVQANPGIASAFQVQQVPMTVGLVAGQPVPLFAGVQSASQMAPLVEELLRVAAQNGVTGRLEAGVAPPAVQSLPEPPGYFQAAYEAIERGDLATAAEAYQTALRENPADPDAAAGLIQVRLLERTTTTDPVAARAAAAANPDDIEAQLLAADLDLVGGHIEDAFGRLVDLVRRTADEERATVRQHLVDLFDVVGGHDARVVAARRALMSALF
ncbi:MAG TPA: tetratricopeptide repeat protein [Dermatophilaceae bacterium]|nr:tetratricopeptide repeat protein [Dermatophilaceae bacterium]